MREISYFNITRSYPLRNKKKKVKNRIIVQLPILKPKKKKNNSKNNLLKQHITKTMFGVSNSSLNMMPIIDQ
jgi:hypothetical protein